MEPLISFNIHQFVETTYSLLSKEIEFVFPNDILERGRVHQTLSRIRNLCIFFNKIIKPQYFQLDDLQILFFKQLKGNMKSFLQETDFAYPNDNLDIDRAWPALNSITAMIRNYSVSHHLFNDYCFKKEGEYLFASFDLIKTIDNFNFKDDYEYAFDSQKFNEGKAHISLLLLSMTGIFFNSFISNIETKDQHLSSMLEDLKSTMKTGLNIIQVAYPKPNYEYQKHLSYKVLNDFYNHWKNIQNKNIVEIKDYLKSLNYDFEKITEHDTKNKNTFDKKIRSIL